MDPFAANRTPVATDTEILDSYPMPVARSWERVLIASPRPSFHHRQLLVMAETLTYYLAAVGLAAYESYVSSGGKADPALNRSLRSLRRPTFGQWLGWVRSSLAAVPATESPLPELAAAYEADDTGMVLLGYESLRPIMVVQLGYSGEYGPRYSASPRIFLELINQYQLRRSNYEPGPDSSFDELGVAASLAPGLRAILGHFAFLANHPLLGLVRDGEGQVHVLRLTGLDARESAIEIDPEAEPPGTLLLADREEAPILVLDPWLVFTTCPEDGQVQIAAFQSAQGNEWTYLGLDCEHKWTVPRSDDTPVQLAEVQLNAPGAEQPTPSDELPPQVAASLPPELGEYEREMFAAFEYESGRLEQDRRMARQQRVAKAAAAETAAQTEAQAVQQARTPDELYRELLDQRAVGGLTLDQIQDLDEQRAANEQRERDE